MLSLSQWVLVKLVLEQVGWSPPVGLNSMQKPPWSHNGDPVDDEQLHVVEVVHTSLRVVERKPTHGVL